MTKNVIRFIAFTLLLSGTFSLCGCWNYEELERRGYILGIAIDKAYPIPKGEEKTDDYLDEQKFENVELQAGAPKYAFTIQQPIIPRALIKPMAGGGGGGETKRTWNLTVLAQSFFEANRLYATRLDYPPFYEHLKVIIISEDVAKEGIMQTLDVMLRDPEMRRRTRVFITSGEAKKLLDVVPRIDDYSALYLEKLPLNAVKNSEILHKVDLSDLVRSIHNNTDFALPRVSATKDEIRDAGSAVFKQGKMVGWLDDIDTVYLKWVRNAVIGGFLVLDSPSVPGHLVTLEVDKAKVKVRPLIENGKIKMNITGKATMPISEKTAGSISNSFDNEYIKEIEKLAEEKLEKGILKTVTRLQKDLGADVCRFNVALARYAPDDWDRVKDRWHDIFPTIEVNIDMDVKIVQTGLVK